MSHNNITLINEARRLFHDLPELEERLADAPETIIAQAFPPPESSLKARSLVWPRLRRDVSAAFEEDGTTSEVFHQITQTSVLSDNPFELLEEGTRQLLRRLLVSARQAVHKIIHEGEDAELEPEEVLGYESIIQIIARPAILIQNGHFAVPPPEWQVLEDVRESIERACSSVGRIEVDDHPFLDYVGTGFLVAHDVIMTNAHVAREFCKEWGEGYWTFRREEYRPAMDYRHEWGTADVARFEITELLGVHPDYQRGIDLALFRIAHESPDNAAVPEPLSLASRYDIAAGEQQVYVIGYPFRREGDPELMQLIFKDIYGYKRLQPGEIMDVNNRVCHLQHDCSTLGGNSGSCVIDLESGQVVGLHFYGRPRHYNKAVALWQLCDDPLLRRAGVHFN